MSRVMEVVIDRLPMEVDSFLEQFVSFGGESLPMEPRQFVFRDAITLTLQPLAAHVRKLGLPRFRGHLR